MPFLRARFRRRGAPRNVSAPAVFPRGRSFRKFRESLTAFEKFPQILRRPLKIVRSGFRAARKWFANRGEALSPQRNIFFWGGERQMQWEVMAARSMFRRRKKAEKRDRKKASRGGCLFVCLRRFDQNAAMMAPLYFSWRKSLTCWLWSVFTSFWISGRFSSPLRTATMFT